MKGSEIRTPPTFRQLKIESKIIDAKGLKAKEFNF
jgi:hypothetical protein